MTAHIKAFREALHAVRARKAAQHTHTRSNARADEGWPERETKTVQAIEREKRHTRASSGGLSSHRRVPRTCITAFLFSS